MAVEIHKIWIEFSKIQYRERKSTDKWNRELQKFRKTKQFYRKFLIQSVKNKIYTAPIMKPELK